MRTQLQDLLPRLSGRIEEEWNRTGYDYAAFPGIACGALGDLDDFQPFEERSLRQWLLSAADLPKQMDPQQKFGDPPITLFHAGRFVIDVYCWLEPALAVHDHAFCGAFAVVSGSTVQITYRFTEKERIGTALGIGDLEPVSVEALPPGSITPIPPGRGFIHTTWHLARPTLTLCVRTVGPPDDAPQAVYFPPHLRVEIAPRFLVGRYLSFMSFEKEARGEEALDDLTGSLLDGGDLLVAFECLKKYVSLTEDWGKVERMLGSVRGQPPGTQDALCQTVRHLHRGFWHYDLKAAQGEGERLLLGLLTTFSHRKPILDAVRQVYPGQDANDLIIGWILAASSSRAISAQVTPANAALVRLALKSVDARAMPTVHRGSGGEAGVGDSGEARHETRSPEMLMLEPLLRQMRSLEALKPLFASS